MHFVIIASPRTGSTHLATTLSGHPEIFCNGNIFKPRKMQLFWPKTELSPDRQRTLLETRRTDPRKFLKLVFEAGFGKPNVGFKIFEGQQEFILDKLLVDPTIRKIVLFRNNVLANYASSISAKTTGRYSLDRGGIAPQPEVVFDMVRFRAFHERYIGFYRRVVQNLQSARQPYYFLRYEDINEPMLLSNVAGFIGADMNDEVATKFKYRQLEKQGSNNIVSRFSNKDIVVEFLAQNNVMCWAHEGCTSFSELSVCPATLRVG